MSWYREVAEWSPEPELAWGTAFSIFRQSVIMQGIAARVAQRQANSAQAKAYADSFMQFGEFSWGKRGV